MFIDDTVEIGRRIKAARLVKKYSQYELSQLTNISTTQISAIENGKRSIGLSTLARLARALEVTMDQLYFGNESVQPITKSQSRGELIVNCVSALFDEKVIKLNLHQKNNYSLEIEQFYKVGLSNHIHEIDDLVHKLTDFEKNKEELPNPQEFKKQLLAAAANKINKNIERMK